MEVKFYDTVNDELLKFAVIISQSNGKWVFCKHKERDTYEMPAGKGFADFVFLPRANAGNRPAMIVELKYNQSADTVIRQIKEKRYQGALVGYEGKILLVGISYDSEKHHTCSIEEW